MSFKEIKDNIRKALGYYWLEIFADSEFIDNDITTMSVSLEELDQIVEDLPDYLRRDKIPLTERQTYSLVLLKEDNLGETPHRYGTDIEYAGSGVIYGDSLGADWKFSYPISDDVRFQFLCLHLTEADVVLTRDVDFRFQFGRIFFKKDPAKIPGVMTRPHGVLEGVPLLETILWGINTETDLNAVRDFFGIMADVIGDTSETYKKTVNVIWDLRIEGATDRNLGRLLSLVSDVDYVEGGVVRDIYNEGDRVCIRTDDKIYTAPTGTDILVEIGDTLTEGQIVFDAYVLHSGKHIIPNEDISALVLDQKYVKGIKGSLLIPNLRVPIGTKRSGGWYDIVHNLTDGYFVKDINGRIIIHYDVAQEEEILEARAEVPEDEYLFYIGGTDADVNIFTTRLNEDGGFFDYLEETKGCIPATINPFEEFRKYFFSDNAFFIKIKKVEEKPFIRQLFQALHKTIPAGAGFFLIMDADEIAEQYTLTVEEMLEVCYVVETGDEELTVNDHITPAPIV